jgi:hypothetical protein
MARAPANPPGSETGVRHQGRAGNSGGPLGSSHERSRAAQPANREEARRPRGSRMFPYERGRGVTPTEQRGTHTGDLTSFPAARNRGHYPSPSTRHAHRTRPPPSGEEKCRLKFLSSPEPHRPGERPQHVVVSSWCQQWMTSRHTLLVHGVVITTLGVNHVTAEGKKPGFEPHLVLMRIQLSLDRGIEHGQLRQGPFADG